MKVSAILKGKPDKLGRQTITIRINEGEERRFKATKMKITPEQWKDGRVVGHPQAAQLNQNLKSILLQHELRNMHQGDRTYPDADFFVYARTCIKNWEGDRSPKTLEMLTYDLSKISQYRERFNLSDITPAFLSGYRAWMKKKGNAPNTVWRSLQVLKTIVNKAISDKVLPKDPPFEGFDFGTYKAPRKSYLTGEQITLLEEKAEVLAYKPRWAPVLCWFLIGCYTGLRFGDMQKFDRGRHVRAGRLVLYTSKTGEVISLPISDRVRGLLERVNYEPMREDNNFFNYAIKSMVKAAGIDIKISAHASRHSFAVLCASSGISQEVCARFLGHTDLATTSIYYRLTGSRTDDEYAKLG